MFGMVEDGQLKKEKIAIKRIVLSLNITVNNMCTFIYMKLTVAIDSTQTKNKKIKVEISTLEVEWGFWIFVLFCFALLGK